ncbi:hypothetical protein [Serratia sp. 14-2641]|nr:hypothetical protein [Serratia sp. 14-2641]
MNFQRFGMGSHFAYVEQLMQVSMQQQAIFEASIAFMRIGN